jgi:hypothetical protein
MSTRLEGYRVMKLPPAKHVLFSTTLDAENSHRWPISSNTASHFLAPYLFLYHTEIHRLKAPGLGTENSH